MSDQVSILSIPTQDNAMDTEGNNGPVKAVEYLSSGAIYTDVHHHCSVVLTEKEKERGIKKNIYLLLLKFLDIEFQCHQDTSYIKFLFCI